MLGSEKLMGILATTDAERARAFYEGVLGLEFVVDDGFAVVFRSGGATLRVAKVAQLTPQPFTALGWEVADVSRTAAGLKARGVTFERFGGMEQGDLGVWSVPGAAAKVAWFKDPAGNLLSISGS